MYIPRQGNGNCLPMQLAKTLALMKMLEMLAFLSQIVNLMNIVTSIFVGDCEGSIELGNFPLYSTF